MYKNIFILFLLTMYCEQMHSQIYLPPITDTTYTILIDSINGNKLTTHIKISYGELNKAGTAITSSIRTENVYDKNNIKRYERTESTRQDKCQLLSDKIEITVFESDGSYNKLIKKGKDKKPVIKRYDKSGKLIRGKQAALPENYEWGADQFKGVKKMPNVKENKNNKH